MFASFLGYLTQRHEPFTWSEELVGPARAASHPQLLALCAMAAQCVLAWRLDDSYRFCEAAEALLGDLRYSPGPFGCARAWIGRIYLHLGSADRCIRLCQAEIDRAGGLGSDSKEILVVALSLTGRDDDARVFAADAVEAAEQRTNPRAVAYALLVYGLVWRHVDPMAATVALRRGLDIASRSGNARTESNIQVFLADMELGHGHIQDALGLLESATTKYHDSGDTSSLRSSFAVLAACLDRLGQHEAAMTIIDAAGTGWAVGAERTLPVTISHLRQVLGDEEFESLTAPRTAVEPTQLIAYALEQVQRARALT